MGAGADGDGAQALALPRAVRGRAPLAARFALFIAAVLIGGCAYLSEKQGELIFRPTRDSWWGYSGPPTAFQDHWIPIDDTHKLHAWWLPAADARAPAILYLHGARWNLTGSVGRIERWRKLGFSVFAVDYRGFGQSADLAPTETGAYDDAQAAWDYLAQLAPDRPRLIVGHSLGGAIAVELARRRPDAAGLVLEATLTSVADMVEGTGWSWLPVGLILTQRFDALSRIGEVKMPILVVHGTMDRVVPIEMGERLYQAATFPKKKFLRVEGASHHNLSSVGFGAYRDAMREMWGIPAKTAFLSAGKPGVP